jgi:CBS-domain-containing membrane protein
VAAGRDPLTTQVREGMPPDVVYGFDDQEIQDAARLMEQYQIRRLLVLNRRQQLVGMVALGDLAVHAGTQPGRRRSWNRSRSQGKPGANSGPREAVTQREGTVQACG